MGSTRKNPFTPGWGIAPPHRAGHEEAARFLEGKLADIAANGRGDSVVLFGPRGNGKTVLLNEARAQARRLGVRAVSPGTGTLRSPRSLAQSLAPRSRFSLRRIRTLFGSFAGVKAAVEIRDVHGSEEEDLVARLRKSPLLVVVDEAHEMPVRTGKFLLQFAQRCVSEGCPLLLLLAGTPGLQAHLGKMGASFWERSEQLGLGRLETEGAVRDALAIPAKESGLPMDEDALMLLVRESQGYPYFIQLLGSRSWDVAFGRRDGPRRIRLEDARAGVRAAGERRTAFYRRRQSEAREHGVLPAAVAVSREVMAAGKGGILSDGRLREVAASAATGGKSPDEIVSVLLRLGIVWETGASDWEPGIPSLCAFLVEHGED